MRLPTPLLLISLIFTTSTLAASSSTDNFDFGTASASASSTGSFCFDCHTTSSTKTSTDDFSFGAGTPTSTVTASDDFCFDCETIVGGFKVTATASGYAAGQTPEPKGKWTLDIHPGNTGCEWGANSVRTLIPSPVFLPSLPL
jgi:hypothetical protein